MYPDLNDDEKRRNQLGANLLMVSKKSKIYAGMRDVYEKGLDKAKMSDQTDALIDAKLNHGIQDSGFKIFENPGSLK